MANPDAGTHPVFLFDSSTHVLWAEEVAGEEGIPVEIIPTPKEVQDSCGIAIRTLERVNSALKALLEAEGIPYREYPTR